MSISNRDYLRLAHAMVKRLSELTLEEIERDLTDFDNKDTFSQWVLRAYWDRFATIMLRIHKIHPKPKTPEEEVRIVEKVFGHWLDLASDRLAADIDARLEWTKRRVSNQFEREFRNAVDRHNIRSPIEQIFLMEWKAAKLEEQLSVQMLPQKVIETTEGTFNLDFFVTHVDSTKNFRIGVELDGHEFHEKTKHQVSQDKRRERAIVRSGITVMRFSGSEVYRDAQKCVAEIADFIRSQRA